LVTQILLPPPRRRATGVEPHEQCIELLPPGRDEGDVLIVRSPFGLYRNQAIHHPPRRPTMSTPTVDLTAFSAAGVEAYVKVNVLNFVNLQDFGV